MKSNVSLPWDRIEGLKVHKIQCPPTGLQDGRDSKDKQLGRWYIGLKEPLDERGERKSWLKAQHSEHKAHGIQSHHFMANRWGNSGNRQNLFFWTPKSLQMVTAAMKLKDAYSLEGKL